MKSNRKKAKSKRARTNQIEHTRRDGGHHVQKLVPRLQEADRVRNVAKVVHKVNGIRAAEFGRRNVAQRVARRLAVLVPVRVCVCECVRTYINAGNSHETIGSYVAWLDVS